MRQLLSGIRKSNKVSVSDLHVYSDGCEDTGGSSYKEVRY